MAKQQFLFAIAEQPESVTGRLYLTTRANGVWSIDRGPIACVFGKNGLTPEKREGDGKSPIGVFALGQAFAKHPHTVNWPVKILSANDVWVDDVEHPLYNQYVDLSQTSKNWASDEYLLRPDDRLYDIVVVVEYNTNPVVSGHGSAIFLHVWRASDRGTAGCTAMSPDDAEYLLGWLDPKAQPRLVQGLAADVPGLLHKVGIDTPPQLL